MPKILLKRKETAKWAEDNPVLDNGEVGLDITPAGTLRLKIGNGLKSWNDLPFADFEDAPNDDKNYVRFKGRWVDVSTIIAASAPTGGGLISLPDIILSQTAGLVITAGVRTVEVACLGAKVGDKLFVTPKEELPSGYAIFNAICLTDNSIKVTLIAPLLSVGSSYSINCVVLAAR